MRYIGIGFKNTNNRDFTYACYSKDERLPRSIHIE